MFGELGKTSLMTSTTLNWDTAKVEVGTGCEVNLVGSPDEVEDVNLFWWLIPIGQQGVQVRSGRSHGLAIHYVVQVPDNTLTGVSLRVELIVLVWVLVLVLLLFWILVWVCYQAWV